MTAAVVLLALSSAAAYGVAAVLQHRAASRQPAQLSMRAGLVARLVRDPVWVLANVLDAGGYALQFLALREGSLVVVEPLLVSSLVLALPVSALLGHERVSAGEVLAAVAVAVGLAGFLVGAGPGVGHPVASATPWLVLGALVIVAIAGCAALAHGRAPSRLAALSLAVAAGLALGCTAALTALTGRMLGRGVEHALTTWPLYALLGAGGVALVATQSAFQAGPLRLSLPTLTVAQPLLAVGIGVVLFGERLAGGGAARALETVSVVVMTVGVFVLAQRVPEPERSAGGEGLGRG